MSTPLAQRAAHVIAQVSPDAPADFVLRREIGTDPDLDSVEKRALTGAVFAFFRWFAWLDATAPLSGSSLLGVASTRTTPVSPGSSSANARTNVLLPRPMSPS
jgi:hypothetical protein